MRKSDFRIAGVLCIILTFCPSVGLGQEVKSCRFGASGDACIFDLTANDDGILDVDTKAGTDGDRWRATIVELGEMPAASNIGLGISTDFTGLVTQSLLSGRSYEVFVTYEAPLSPGVFPTNVEVRFTGPVAVSDPRPGTRPLPTRYAGKWFHPMNSFSILVSADRSEVIQISAGVLVCDPLHPDSFTVDLSPGIPITIRPDGLPGFSAQDIPIPIPPPFGTHPHSLDIDGVFFDADGVGGTLEQALGGFSFFSGSFGRCNHIWRATSVTSDSDGDGWSDTAELRLGSNPANAFRTPEHREVPTTDLNGPDTCNDLADNDGDGLVDGDDPGCQP